MLARLLQRSSTYNDSPIVWSLPGGFGVTQAGYGAAGGVEEALKNAATYACIRVMSDALARTPVDVVRDIRGASTPVDPIPRVIAQPSALVTTDVWRGQLGFSLMTDGNAFAQVLETAPSGLPTALELLDPTTVTDRKVVKGRPQVRVGQTGTQQLYPDGEIWHMPGDMVQPGSPFGLSPVTYAAKLIGTSLSAEDFSYRFFSDGGHPSYAIHADAPTLTQEQSDKIKTSWQRATRGSREPAVFGSGLKVEQFPIDPHETQFLDLMRFCVEQACRIFGVPPTMIFASVSGQHMTYANVTQADLHFLKHALEGKFVRMESAFTNLLPGNNYSAPSVANTRAVMRRSAILKADAMSRYQTYALGIANRFLTINEVRAAEDTPLFDEPDYNEPSVPPFAPTQAPLGVDVTAGANITPVAGTEDITS